MKRKHPKVKLRGKGQATRLGTQHETSGGPLGIFGEEAQKHDSSVRRVVKQLENYLKKKYPRLKFRHRTTVSKQEINEKLKSLNKNLGHTLFVENSNIKPDGGIMEVKDRFNKWRIVFVGESKHQGNDIEKILAGIKQGKNKNKDLMVAGNAIERVHKNIQEIRNLMLDEPSPKKYPFIDAIEVYGWPDLKAIKIEVDVLQKAPFRVIEIISSK